MNLCLKYYWFVFFRTRCRSVVLVNWRWPRLGVEPGNCHTGSGFLLDKIHPKNTDLCRQRIQLSQAVSRWRLITAEIRQRRYWFNLTNFWTPHRGRSIESHSGARETIIAGPYHYFVPYAPRSRR